MGKITGLMGYKRKTSADIPPLERMEIRASGRWRSTA